MGDGVALVVGTGVFGTGDVDGTGVFSGVGVEVVFCGVGDGVVVAVSCVISGVDGVGLPCMVGGTTGVAGALVQAKSKTMLIIRSNNALALIRHPSWFCRYRSLALPVSLFNTHSP